MIGWANRIFDALAPQAVGGVYVNYLDTAAGIAPDAAWGDNRERLAELKHRWDPENLFGGSPAIPPAARRHVSDAGTSGP